MLKAPLRFTRFGVGLAVGRYARQKVTVGSHPSVDVIGHVANAGHEVHVQEARPAHTPREGSPHGSCSTKRTAVLRYGLGRLFAGLRGDA